MFDWAGIGESVLGNVAGRVVGSLFGDGRQNNDVSGQWQANADLQREFAQHGIRWRVEDAKAAGVHPLYALGAQPASASPIYMDGGSRDTWSGLGQDISRAVAAGRTVGERVDSKLSELQLERAELENELLRKRIAHEGQIGPPMPGAIDRRPVELQTTEPGRPDKEAGSTSDWTHVDTADGGKAIIPSRDFKDRGEDQTIPEILWALRNGLMPNIDPEGHRPASDSVLREWVWNPLKQQYEKRFVSPPRYVKKWRYRTTVGGQRQLERR